MTRFEPDAEPLADWHDENIVGFENAVGTKVQKITEKLYFLLRFEFQNR